MSRSATPVHVVDQDEDVAAAAWLRDRDQRRYGRVLDVRLPQPPAEARQLRAGAEFLNGKVGFVGPFRTEEIARSWHNELWPYDDLPWSVEPMAAPHA